MSALDLEIIMKHLTAAAVFVSLPPLIEAARKEASSSLAFCYGELGSFLLLCFCCFGRDLGCGSVGCIVDCGSVLSVSGDILIAAALVGWSVL